MTTLRIPVTEQMMFTQESATQFVQLLSRFDSSVMIHDHNRTINAKSLLGILSLGFIHSDALEFFVDGTDEKEACETITEFFKDCGGKN